MVSPDLASAAESTLASLRAFGLTMATAESCTGGLVAAALTAIAGSSDVLECGFVTYTNAAKTAMLGVPAALFASDGAVSEKVARAMAEGALAHSTAAIAVAITGIAGPGGATPGKPVGLVHFASARRGGATVVHAEIFPGDRGEIRRRAALTALTLAAAAASPPPPP